MTSCVVRQFGYERQPDIVAAGAMQKQHRFALAAPVQMKPAYIELQEFAALLRP